MKNSKENYVMKNELNPADINSDIAKSQDTLIKSFILKNCISSNVPLKNFMGNFEREMICRALKVSGGNQRIASFILGVKPTTLNEKIKKFKISEIRKPKSREDLKYFLNDINISLL